MPLLVDVNTRCGSSRRRAPGASSQHLECRGASGEEGDETRSQTDSGLILTWEDLALSRIDARQSLDSRFLRFVSRLRPVYILSMTLDAAIYGAFVKDKKRSTDVSRNDTEE